MKKILLFISLLSFAHAQGGFGIAPISRGGTGANTAAQAAINLGVGSTSSPNFVAVNIYDTGAPTRLLKFQSTSSGVLTANRTLTFNVADSNRTITLSGNPTLNDWFDQSVKVSASPTFAAITSSGNVTVGTGSLSIRGTIGLQGIVVTGTTQDFNYTGTGRFILNTPNGFGGDAFKIISGDGSAGLTIQSPAASLVLRDTTNGYSLLSLSRSGFRINTSSGDALVISGLDISSGGALSAGTVIKAKNYIVSGLPTASSWAGGLVYVTDATLTVITGLGLAVTGGGSNKVICYSDGTNWIIL